MDKTSLDNLHLFLAVADAGGFSKAADRLDLPVATLSRRIAALEKELGIPLFKRNTRNVSLTPAGELFYEKLTPALGAVQSAMNDLSDMSSTLKGVIKLTAAADFTRHCLTTPFTQFLADHPEITLELALNTQRMDLIKEHIDVAIRIGRLNDSNLFATHLFDMVLKLYASPKYLASHQCIRAPQDLGSCNFIRLKTNPSHDRFIQLHRGNEVIEQGIQSNAVLNDVGVIMSLAQAGAGVALIPEPFIQNQLSTGLLVPVLPDWHSEITPIHAVTTSRNPPARVKALIATLKHDLQKYQHAP